MALFTRLQNVTVDKAAKGFVARGELSDHIYSMSLKVAVDESLAITDIAGQMIRYTTDRCPLGLETLAAARGLRLDQPDFESQVKKQVGRPGCRHLATLLVNMGRSVIRARRLGQGEGSGC